MTAKKVDTKKTDERIHSVEEVYSKTEAFIEKNQKIILIVVGILIVIVLGFFGFKKYYIEPQEKEAQSQLFMAEMYFDQDSLQLALNGDGNYFGFLEIIDQYGLTKSANLATYYAGITYLRLGEFDHAIEYLKKFDGDDDVAAPMAVGAIGDAYMELDEIEKAKVERTCNYCGQYHGREVCEVLQKHIATLEAQIEAVQGLLFGTDEPLLSEA